MEYCWTYSIDFIFLRSLPCIFLLSLYLLVNLFFFSLILLHLVLKRDPSILESFYYLENFPSHEVLLLIWTNNILSTFTPVLQSTSGTAVLFTDLPTAKEAMLQLIAKWKTHSSFSLWLLWSSFIASHNCSFQKFGLRLFRSILGGKGSFLEIPWQPASLGGLVFKSKDLNHIPCTWNMFAFFIPSLFSYHLVPL